MIVTDKLFKNYLRPLWAGLVMLDDFIPGGLRGQQLRPGANARSVKGIIVPTSTKGRPSPPAAYSGTPTGKLYGTDRGHLMGLELGGPDIHENIAPQTSLWQQSGGWRDLEKAVVQEALQAMGWLKVGDPYLYRTPADVAPKTALYFSVSPASSTVGYGEPDFYIGSIVKVSPFLRTTGNWDYETSRNWYRNFIITPGGFAWN